MFVYSFSLIFTSSILLVLITRKHPVTALLCLVGYLCNITFLMIYLGVDYVGLLFLMIYAGAIPILVLFVTMLIDVKELALRRYQKSSLLLVILVGLHVLLIGCWVLLVKTDYSIGLPRVQYTDWFSLFFAKDNIHTIGHTLYTLFPFQFVVLGFILFFLLVIIIGLIHKEKKIRRQDKLNKQLSRSEKVGITK